MYVDLLPPSLYISLHYIPFFTDMYMHICTITHVTHTHKYTHTYIHTYIHTHLIISSSFFVVIVSTAILSGRDLFTYNSALFIDDDAAIDANEENDLNEQTRRDQEKEEAEEAMEAARAQAEQERLQQVQYTLVNINISANTLVNILVSTHPRKILSLGTLYDWHALSSHPINTPYQHIISTHPINTPYQHTLSTHPIITPSQHTLSTHPIITPSQHTLSSHPVIIPYHHTLSTHHIKHPLNTPYYTY